MTIIIISSEKELSIEQAFTVCVCFFVDLWDLIDPMLPSPKDEGIHASHYLFCRIVCLEAMSDVDAVSPAAWNEAVYQSMNIPKENQKNYKLSLEEILECMIKFCKIYNHKCESELKFLIDLLESLKQDHRNYPKEWLMLKKIFAKVLRDQINIMDFDWNVNFSHFF